MAVHIGPCGRGVKVNGGPSGPIGRQRELGSLTWNSRSGVRAGKPTRSEFTETMREFFAA